MKLIRRFFYILSFLLFAGAINAQVGLQLKKSNPSLDRTTYENIQIDPPNLPDLETLILNPASAENYKAYNYNHLAFFCKVEVQLEKKTKIPIKFRLGDVRYVDWLEGKIDSY